jgi:CRISPR-associated protein Cmr2
MKKHYLALTIGPMDRTLEATRSTRAVWSASYLFSWIMREIVKKLRDIDGVACISPFNGKLNDIDFCDDTPRGVGLFHDRIIVEANTSQLAAMNEAIEAILDDLSEKIHTIVEESSEKIDAKTIKTYLQQYLQFHKIEIHGETNFTEISEYLDTAECQSVFMQQETQPYLVDFFEYLKEGKYSAFIKAHFGNNGRFPSTPEIATADLSKKYADEYSTAINILRKKEEAIYSETHDERNFEKRRLKRRKKEIDAQILFYQAISTIARQRHKYMAIVQADGDYMGSLIKSIQAYYQKNERTKPQSERFELFSKQLMSFAWEATQEIKAFGATPIYAGGDDLLFFSPLVGKEGKSFLTLMDNIDAIFKEKIADNEVFTQFFEDGTTHKPTMSYGISITYYKFPLGETRAQAATMLFEKAKTGNKNKLAFEVQKHSGAQFGGVFERDKCSYEALKSLVENRLKDDNTGEKLINSIGHKLESLEGLLKGIVKDANKEKITTHLENFFYNSFDEPIHKTAAGKQYLGKVCAFITAILTENPNIETELPKIYGALRLVHFLQAPFNAEEDQSFTKLQP